jgi:hypothetical protein
MHVPIVEITRVDHIHLQFVVLFPSMNSPSPLEHGFNIIANILWTLHYWKENINVGMIFHECVSMCSEQVNMNECFLEYFVDVDGIFGKYYLTHGT